MKRPKQIADSVHQRRSGTSASLGLLLMVLGASTAACTSPTMSDEVQTKDQEIFGFALPNNFPIWNGSGLDASYSTDGFIDLTSAFATPQGTNGRDCTTCHSPLDGWSLTPATAQRWFDETDGLHPLFNIKDANQPTADVSTVEARREAFSMLLQAKFIRRRSIPSGAEYECIGADDPFDVGSCSRIINFRTSMATHSFRSVTVSWDGGNTQDTLHAGLIKQATSNVTGAQQGDPASEETLEEIVAFESNMSHAQLTVPGAGLLTLGGAKGGPKNLSEQEFVSGEFDLYDAWRGSWIPKRAQIARGQDLFNNGDANGKTCSGCHNSKNDGQNVAGLLFDVGASRPEFAKDDMAIYTFRNLATGEERSSTDIGRALRTGKWSDMDRFKTPTLRGLAARAPYFHNGIAEDLEAVVEHYEVALGFDFTDQEEADLVAFMNAL